MDRLQGEHGALWEVGVGNPDHLLLQGESGKFEISVGFCMLHSHRLFCFTKDFCPGRTFFFTVTELFTQSHFSQFTCLWPVGKPFRRFKVFAVSF